MRYNIVPRKARQHSSRCWRVPYFVPGDGIDARGLQLTSAFAQTLPCCHQRRPTRLHWPCETSWSWGTTCTVIPTVPVLHSYRRSTTVLGKGARAWGPAAWGGLAGGRRWLSLPSCSYPSHDDDRSNTLPAPRSGQPAQTIFTSSGHRRHAISSHPQTCVSLACWPKSLGLRNNITSPRPPQPPTGAKNQYGYGTVQCCIHIGTRDAPKAQQSTVSHRTALRQQAGDGLPAPAPLFCATPAAVQIRLPSTPRLLLCLTRTWHNTAGSVLSNTSTEEASHSGWARGAASPSRPPSRLACDSSRLQAQRPAPPSHQSAPAQVRQRLASARVLPLCRLSTGSRERGRGVGEPPARFDSLRVATLQPRALVCASLCCSP